MANAVNRRTLAGLIIGIFISGACLWYAFRGVDLAAMISEIGQVGVAWVLSSVACSLLSLVVRAVRWRVLLAGIKVVGTGSLLSATFIGFMVNNVLPGRLGEMVRAWVLARREQMSVSTVLASVILERLLDVIAALMILGLCLAMAPDLGGEAAKFLRRTGLVVMLLMAIGVSILLLVVRFRERLLCAVERWSTRVRWRRMPRAIELLSRFLDGFCVLRSFPQAVSVAALSFLVWGTAIASFYVLAKGFGLSLTLVQTTLVFVIVLLGIALPSAPGSIGTFHGFVVAGLVLVAGTESTVAAGYATVLHGSHWLAITGVGIVCLAADRSLTWATVGGFVKQT